MNDPFDPNEDTVTAGRSRIGCFAVGIAVLIVISLLASSAYGLFWLISSTRSQATAAEGAALPDPTTAVAVTADPPAASEGGEGNSADSLQAPIPLAEASPESLRVNRIVFVNEEGGLETMAPDGSERHVLTGNRTRYQFPAWSPDGRHIAALGGSISGGGVYMLEDNEGGASPRELYFSASDSPFYLYWAPDSRRLTFLAGDQRDGIALNIVDLGQESATGPFDPPRTRRIAGGSPFYWHWTADSESLLIHSGSESEDSRLLLIDDNGRARSPQIDAPGFFQAPGISPSGRFWAYSQLQDGGTSWLVVDDVMNDVQTSDRHAGSLALAWSPAADQLAYISGTAAEFGSAWGPLRLFDAASGETRVLSSETVMAFFWSPDGSRVATISLPSIGDLGGVDVRAPKLRALARAAATGFLAQNIPHLFILSVIDVASGSGLQLGEIEPSPFFLGQFLPFFDQYALSHRIWSPDSDTLVLPLRVNGENQIVTFDAGSGRMRQLDHGLLAFWSQQ
jgi:TolB protein